MRIGTVLVAGLMASWTLLTACSAGPRSHAVPSEVQDRAVVSGLTPAARTWGGGMNEAFRESMKDSITRERAALAAAGHTGPLPPADFLAISGGGQNGAFGAGMLCAWTDMGTRPDFKVVTGISTGGLTAPFVFAGKDFDGVLREVYTKTRTGDILISRGIIAAISNDALADTAPLWKLVSKHVNEKLLDAIAAEHRKGRILLIGTTNLDARRAVLWNIGEIASNGGPDALAIVRKVMIASAAIPAAFPPVMIDVEVDGVKYQEMHVDGGAMTQVFLYPPSLKLKEEAAAAGTSRERIAYIIRNSRLDPDWAEVERRTMSIAARAIDAMITTQGIGDLYRTYLNCQRDEVAYNLACIPRTFHEKPKEAFDPEYMTKLFEVGYTMMKNGYPWAHSPPGFDSPFGEE